MNSEVMLSPLLPAQVLMKAMTKEEARYWNSEELAPQLADMKAQMTLREQAAEEAKKRCQDEARAAKEAKQAERRAQAEAQIQAAEVARQVAAARAAWQAEEAAAARSARTFPWGLQQAGLLANAHPCWHAGCMLHSLSSRNPPCWRLAVIFML